MDKAAWSYYRSLNDKALTYLEGRGFGDPNLLEKYLLGVVVDPEPGHEDYVGRLAIPYQTPSGVVALRFRCIEDHECKDVEKHAKYLDLAGQAARLYNVLALQEAGSVIYVCEGELDAITASEIDYPAIGVSGASKWEDHWERLLEDFEDVVVLADGDDAGRKFAKMILSHVEWARIVCMPDGEDVNSFVMSHEPGAFDKLPGIV